MLLLSISKPALTPDPTLKSQKFVFPIKIWVLLGPGWAGVPCIIRSCCIICNKNNCLGVKPKCVSAFLSELYTIDSPATGVFITSFINNMGQEITKCD